MGFFWAGVLRQDCMSGDVGRRLGCSGYAAVHSADVLQLSRPLESKVTKIKPQTFASLFVVQ